MNDFSEHMTFSEFLVLATGAESTVSGAEAVDEEDAGGSAPGGGKGAAPWLRMFQNAAAWVDATSSSKQ